MARSTQKPNPSTVSMTPQCTQISSETYWAAGEWPMSYDWLLNPERHRVAGRGWIHVTPRSSVNVSKICGGTYKVHIQLHTEKHSFTHIYMCSQVHTHSETHTPAVSVLPCVSSFARSHSLCEEGPNFSLISFIKRCREERRKRRQGEGETGGKSGWGSDWWVMNRALHRGMHHLVHKRGCMKVQDYIAEPDVGCVLVCRRYTVFFFYSKPLCNWQIYYCLWLPAIKVTDNFFLWCCSWDFTPFSSPFPSPSPAFPPLFLGKQQFQGRKTRAWSNKTDLTSVTGTKQVLL